jgi:acyl-CoA synthetase (AMP-forming)/AMP-acid ligase II
VVDVIVAEGVTGMFVPGPLLGPILDEVDRRSGIEHRLRRSVCFFVTPQLLERTAKLLGRVWTHGFGSTEQGAVTTRLLPHQVVQKPEREHSVGRPGSPFLELAIMDPQGTPLPPRQLGEIAVRSAMSLGEYWRMPDQTAAAFFPGGWFRSSDLGYLDEDGYLYFVGRATDTIRTQDASARIDLPAHEWPTCVIFVTELPTVLGGAKVQREVLRDRLTAITAEDPLG